MEIYDIVMLVVLVGAMLFGAIKGFAWQLASIASIVVSYLVAYHFREPFSQSIQAEPPWNRFLAMLILYVGTSLVIWVAFRMVSGSIDRLRLREFDRQIGALFGLAKGALYCILITLFAVTLMGNTAREKIVESKSGNYIANTLARTESMIPPEIQEIVQPYLDRFEDKFNSGNQGGSESPLEQVEQIGGQFVQERAGEFLPDSFWSEPSEPSARVGFRSEP
ncbi:Colicin V production protein [Novipirellula aureliae]|uniref:Colicin V production protein n=1 Tax=Novipirellula aureliae TaxID=2527966 RepID=A0A5C6E870_9BACT|nr:CvpA family protein [Novipirellula aureliae]TWU43881.1 Colicin V production protein [Novipirellula aureliae]